MKHDIAVEEYFEKSILFKQKENEILEIMKDLHEKVIYLSNLSQGLSKFDKHFKRLYCEEINDLNLNENLINDPYQMYSFEYKFKSFVEYYRLLSNEISYVELNNIDEYKKIYLNDKLEDKLKEIKIKEKVKKI